MMFLAILAFILAVAQQASAHFKIDYPPWRLDSLQEEGNFSQWTWPCAGVPPDGVYNRTDWPLTGGALEITLHHPWTYVFVNLGLGDVVTNFNMSLTPDLINTTHPGKLCLPSLPVPMDVTDGTKASIQVITADQSGALYNCADITFRSTAKVPDGMCMNSSTISATVIGQQTNMPMAMAPNATVTVSATSPPTSTPNSAAKTTTGELAFVAMVGLTCLFATGLGM